MKTIIKCYYTNDKGEMQCFEGEATITECGSESEDGVEVKRIIIEKPIKPNDTTNH